MFNCFKFMLDIGQGVVLILNKLGDIVVLLVLEVEEVGKGVSVAGPEQLFLFAFIALVEGDGLVHGEGDLPAEEDGDEGVENLVEGREGGVGGDLKVDELCEVVEDALFLL
jgi:hypothetical protein